MRHWFLKWNFKQKMILLASLVILPVFLIIMIFNYLLQGPIQDHLISESTNGVARQMKTANTQVSNLETYAYTLSSTLDPDQLPKNLTTLPHSLTTLNQASNQLFLLENDSTIVAKAVLYVNSSQPYLINSSGTSQNSVKTYRHLIGKKQSRSWQSSAGQLYLVQPIGTDTQANPVTLIVQVSVDHLMHQYAPTLGHNYAYLLADKHQFGSKLKTNFKLGNQDSVWYQGQRYQVLKYQVSHLNQVWTYFSLVSLGNVFDSITEVSAWITVVTLLVSGLLIWLVYWFQHSFYTPVQRLIRLAGNTDTEQADELQVLQQQWEQLLTQQATAAASAEQDRERLKSNFFIQAMQGRFAYLTPTEIDKKAAVQGLTLNADQPWCFIRLQLTDLISPTNHRVTDDPNLANFMFGNVATDLARKYFQAAYLLTNEHATVTLLVRAADATTLHAFTQTISQNLNHLLAKYITVIISTTITQWPDLVAVHDQLEIAKNYQKLELTNQEILLATVDPTEFNQQLPIADVAEARLLAALRNQETTQLPDYLHLILQPYFEAHRPQISLFNTLEKCFFDCRSLIQSYSADPSVLISETLLLQGATPLFRENELADFLLVNLFQPTLGLLRDSQSQDIRQKLMHILDFLQHHFSDQSLSLEQTAENYNLDSYALSRAFKTETGLSYTDYLTNIRLTYAKKALRESTKLISTIATESGYQPSYFNRLFKRQVGMTPGQYRKQK